MYGSMADIQSAAAEIRRGKKEERKKKKETTRQKYNGPPITRATIKSNRKQKCYPAKHTP